MEALKLIGAGHKVLLVRDDLAKLVDLGSTFSFAPKKEYLFFIKDITSVDVKKPTAFSPGSIRIQGDKIAPALRDDIFVSFKGYDNYKIAISMKQHIKCFLENAVDDKKTTSDTLSKQDKSTIHIPPKLGGKLLAYRCPCVPIANLDYDASIESAEKQEWQLNVEESNGTCSLYSRGLKIGEIGNEDVSGMLADWIHRDEPYLIYLLEVYTEEKSANATVAFYLDRRERLSAQECDIVKLTSYNSEDAQMWIGHIDEGEELGVHEEHNYETGKSYIGVFWSGTEIGHLPSKYTSHFLDQRIRGCFFEKCETSDNLKDIPYVKIYW